MEEKKLKNIHTNIHTKKEEVEVEVKKKVKKVQDTHTHIKLIN